MRFYSGMEVNGEVKKRGRAVVSLIDDKYMILLHQNTQRARKGRRRRMGSVRERDVTTLTIHTHILK